jgi:hypothetical protein
MSAKDALLWLDASFLDFGFGWYVFRTSSNNSDSLDELNSSFHR